METRRCYRCEREMPVVMFPSDRTKGSGRKSICRLCDNEKSRVYYTANRERKRNYNRERTAAKYPGGIKMCKACGERPVPNSHHWYCARCRQMRKRHKQREKELRRPYRGTREERGYGKEHKLLRSKIAPLVESGLANCARCGKPISATEPWDLGHDDHDRTKYIGPEHRGCNRATSGRRLGATSRAPADPLGS